jgi:hypothetical protein
MTKAPSLGYLTDLLPTSRKTTCDKLSITSNISPYIRQDATFVFLSSFLPCHAIFSPSLTYKISSPSPKYPLFTHFFSVYMYTPYKSAITAPTTPNNPTPTFTLPAAFFPVVLAAVPAPELVLLGVPLPVALALVFVPLALPVLFVLL